MTERLIPAGGGQDKWTTYIQADGHIVAQRATVGANNSPVMRYFVLDVAVQRALLDLGIGEQA